MAASRFISFFVLLTIGVPIAVSLGVAAMSSLVLFGHTPVMVLVQKTFGGIDSFTLLAIPLFILAGNIMSTGGVSTRLVALASCGFGRYRGGLAQVLTVACTFFGAISGSAPATAAAIGSVMIDPMVKRGYPVVFAAACTAASGVIGLLIPPSVTMVVYGVVTGASIGQLFLGGVIPGLIMSGALMICNFTTARRMGIGREAKPVPGETLNAFKSASWAMLMPFVILGGIYSGIFTPTESAVVAAVYGLIVGKFIYRELGWKALIDLTGQTTKNSAVLMFLVATAHCFSYLMASEQIPETIASFMLGVSNDPTVILVMVCVVLLIVGTFLDNVIAMLLLAPIFHPVIVEVGIDQVYFGIIMVVSLAIGQITPPVGTTLFVACNIAKISLEKLATGISLYLIAMIVVLGILVAFPGIVMLIPNTMIQ
jgi:C4-dicarboxylate transporter DctM subunit